MTGGDGREGEDRAPGPAGPTAVGVGTASDHLAPPKNLIEHFVRHPVAANLVMALLLIAGAFAILNLNTQFFPPTEIKEVEISVAWPGASAEDVSNTILDPVDSAVRFLDGVTAVRSYAREGGSFTSVEFDPSTSVQKALADVEQAIDAITTLPEEAETPVIQAERFRDTVVKIGVSGPYSEAALQEFADEIVDDLLERGVEKVTLTGMRDREIRIAVDEHDLRRLGLSIEDIGAAVRNNTVDRPSGTLEGIVDSQVRVLAPGETAETLKGIEVKAFASGERVLLGEVADVRADYDRDAITGLRQGNPAIELQVWRSTGQDAIEVDRIVRDYLAEAGPQLPETLSVKLYDSRTELLWGRIAVLINAGWQGLLVVLVVLFVFLRARIAFWVAFGIPVALAGALAAMFATGQTINMISLFALLMMLGIIVDDAIVVGEETDTLLEKGYPPERAAELGARRMLAPVMAASITTIASFAPLYLMGGVIGQLTLAMPLVAIAVIVASLIECFLILPRHLSHGLEGRPSGYSPLRLSLMGLALVVALALVVDLPREGAPAAYLAFAGVVDAIRSAAGPVGVYLAVTLTAAVTAGLLELVLSRPRRTGPGLLAAFRTGFDRRFNAFRDGPFGAFVALTYRFRYTTAAVAIAAVMVVVWGLYLSGGHVRFMFFPNPESEFLTARIEFNAGAPRERVIDAVVEIERSLRATEEALAPPGEVLVRDTYAVLGRAGRVRGDNVGELRIQLAPSELRTVRTPEIVRAFKERLPTIPGVREIAVSERRGGPPGRDVDVKLAGADVQTLKRAAQDVAAALETFPGVTGVADDLPYGKPEYALRLTPRGAALGFTLDSVGRQLRNAYEGMIARRLAAGDEEITVRVQRVSAGGAAPALRDLALKTPTGEFAALSEVVDIEERNSFSIIQRRNGVVSVSVTADTDAAVITPREVTDELERTVLPRVAATYGVTYELIGRDEERRRAFSDLQQGTLVALALIYIVLAWTFGSYSRPIAVMLIIPFGAVGMVIGHWLLGFNLSILSFAGLLGLTGILVNDSIILVRRMDERLDTGEEIGAAAIGASRDRLRAVLLTSITTIGGLIPLLFEASLQAQFLKPMAVTIVFGLGATTLIVLFLVPSVVGIGNDIGRIVRPLIARGGGTGTPARPSG